MKIMGRRNKSTALNQISAKSINEPIVATPEQIEEMQKEGTKMLAEKVNKKILDDIEELKEPAKLLTPELESVVPLAEPPNKEPNELNILEKGAGLKYSEDYVENPDMKHTLVQKTPAAAFMGDFPEKKMSVADKRKKLRLGMKPNK